MTNDMPRKHSRRLDLTSATTIALMLAASCGGPYPAQTQTASQSGSEAATPPSVTEKPFAAGGRIEMQLDGGTYVVRAARDNVIRVVTAGAAKVDITTQDTHASVGVNETPHRNFQATIEVPQSTDLVIRLAAGDLKIEAINGNKNVESNAGNVDIVTGESTDYASVDASVQAGEIKAGAFGESRSGLLPRLSWSGKGKYTLHARLIAGELTLRSR